MEKETTENIDSPNDEKGNDNPENVEQEKGQDEPGENETTDKKPEYSENEKKLYARAKKAEEELKELKNSSDKSKNESVDDVVLTRLEVRGVMEAEDQQYVLRFAKAEGKSPLEVLNDEIVQDRLKANERKRNSDKATPRSNNRTNNKEDEVAMWVRKYKNDNSLPENNPALTSKILSKLRQEEEA